MLVPPLLVSYSSVEEYLAALDPAECEQYEADIVRLVESGFPPVVSSQSLAVLFGFSTKFINAMSHQNWKYYRTFKIPKGNAKRKIQAPKVAIKVIQKWFGYYLSEAIPYDDCVYGFIKGKSAVAAAGKHINANWVYSVDISDFFPSTPRNIIIPALIGVGYSETAAKLISGLVCFHDNLAQGSPASPVLSNLVFNDLDLMLKKIAVDNNIRFTRYADDIIFSSEDDNFPENIKEEIVELFAPTCWELSNEKEYFAQLPNRLKVHGLLVHGDKPRLTKGYRNRIRAYKHLLNSGKVSDEDLKRIKGHINYADSVERFGE